MSQLRLAPEDAALQTASQLQLAAAQPMRDAPSLYGRRRSLALHATLRFPMGVAVYAINVDDSPIALWASLARVETLSQGVTQRQERAPVDEVKRP